MLAGSGLGDRGALLVGVVAAILLVSVALDSNRTNTGGDQPESRKVPKQVAILIPASSAAVVGFGSVVALVAGVTTTDVMPLGIGVVGLVVFAGLVIYLKNLSQTL